MSSFLSCNITRNEVPELAIIGYRETMFFSTVEQKLCQWIELSVENNDKKIKLLEITINSKGHQTTRRLVIQKGSLKVKCFAPSIWPDPPDDHAKLSILYEDRRIEGTITIGNYRPWTLYVLSDACADDTWAYADHEKHDKDDYLTSIAELSAGQQNRYNYPSVYQIARFLQAASPEEKDELARAVYEKRFYVSPIPNQLLCGVFTLSTYPLILEPYRFYMERLLGNKSYSTNVAYHMEAPSWTNGLVNLLSSAGFKMFGKSLLRFLAPWIDSLESLPALTRLETSPGNFVYLVLRCGDYFEGLPILSGLTNTNDLVHYTIIPRYQSYGKTYPLSLIPIIGTYSDLKPNIPGFAQIKIETIEEYNTQDWEYPRLVNASWEEFFETVIKQLGDPKHPYSDAVLTTNGDTGSCWEAWLLSAMNEYAGFRKAQRDVISLQALTAVSDTKTKMGLSQSLKEAELELIELGDHAWNGPFKESKEINISVRRDRLSKIERISSSLRSQLAGNGLFTDNSSVFVFNSLGWKRSCYFEIPEQVVAENYVFYDVDSGNEVNVWNDALTGKTWGYVANVPEFGYRELKIKKGKQKRISDTYTNWPIDIKHMRPQLFINHNEVDFEGEWDKHASACWKNDYFEIRAKISDIIYSEASKLSLSVKGDLPEDPYELCLLIDLPWQKVVWRGESGGGFSTPGPTEEGGDSLLGSTGAIFSCGEALTVRDYNSSSCIDFGFEENGMCGLGHYSTKAGSGGYGEHSTIEERKRSIKDSTISPGKLVVYLLGNQMNRREALLDQGGNRSWFYHISARKRESGFNDAGLYRFGSSHTYPGEFISPDFLDNRLKNFLEIDLPEEVIPLRLSRREEDLEIDFYNTANKILAVRIKQFGKELNLLPLDMIGREKKELEDTEGKIPSKSFARFRITI